MFSVDIRGMILTYDHQRWRGRRLLKTIDRATRNLNIPADTNWLETYSLSEWNERPIEEIEKSMKLNHAFIIRSTGLNAGWNFDMRSATKIKGGPQLVEVQGTPITHPGQRSQY